MVYTWLLGMISELSKSYLMKKILSIVLGCFILTACTGIFCGKLDKEHQQMIDSVNIKYNNYFEVTNTPCEYIYLDLHLKTKSLDSTIVNDAHKILFNHETKTGWQTIKIYNVNNEYVISHSWRGHFYYQTGD